MTKAGPYDFRRQHEAFFVEPAGPRMHLYFRDSPSGPGSPQRGPGPDWPGVSPEGPRARGRITEIKVQNPMELGPTCLESRLGRYFPMKTLEFRSVELRSVELRCAVWNCAVLGFPPKPPSLERASVKFETPRL